MAADGVDLSFYASRTFLREWKGAFPTMKDCAVSKADLLSELILLAKRGFDS